MQTNLSELVKQLEQQEVTLTADGLEDMRNDCMDMLQAIIAMLDGAKYLWQGVQKTELKMIRMSEVESQEVKWLWYPFIPYGKLTIIQGDPGDGKTTLVLNIAAKLSKGESLDSDMNVQEPVNVIYQTAEDGLADKRLEEALVKTGAKVLILDPIQAYLGGGMDMNRANEARDMTKKLGALAEKYQCAILLIGHMNKASGNKAAYRGMGSIDFFAVARSVLLVGRIEGESNTRAVVQIKNNLAAFGHPKAFMLSETCFRWLGDYEITADEVLGGIAPKANKLEQAKQMLRELAETTNMVQSNEIFEMADKQGISKRTLENAKKELGIQAKKINNSWYLVLEIGCSKTEIGQERNIAGYIEIAEINFAVLRS